MAKVKRFIYNSDFMTIAKVGHEEVTATIPAKKDASYAGWIELPINIPKRSFPRYQVKYQATSQYAPLQWLAVDSFILLTNYQSGREISYLIFPLYSEGKLVFFYHVLDMSSQAIDNPILIDSQTFTVVLDFLQQPNT